MASVARPAPLGIAPRGQTGCRSCPQKLSFSNGPGIYGQAKRRRSGGTIRTARFRYRGESPSGDALWDPEPGYWDEHLGDLEEHTIIRPVEGAISVGAGAPPIATEDGLLLFFHERERDSQYTAKVALLDTETGRVLSLLPDPIMRPELAWERKGDIRDIIFVQGAVPRPDGTIYLTYGAADRCVGAASVATAEIMRALRSSHACRVEARGFH